MLCLPSRTTLSILAVVLCHVSGAATSLAQKNQIEFKPRPGVVWFIATVTNDEDGLPTIDIGDASGVIEGEPVALFRPVEGYYQPVGSLKIDTTVATYSIPEKTSRLTPRAGDRVVYVRTLSQLGEADEFRERFLDQQIAKAGIQNHYSTLQRQDQVDALAKILARQPRWQRDQKAIAGYFRSQSVSADDLNELKPVLKQVLRFQDFSTLRVPIADTAGKEWANVIETLTPEIAEAFPENRQYVLDAPKAKTSDDENFAEIEAKKAEEAEKLAAEDAALKRRVARIRKIVDTMLYSRPDEQRHIIVTLCAALEKFKPAVESSWYAAEVQLTQFPYLKDDPQFVSDIQAVMRKVREEQ